MIGLFWQKWRSWIIAALSLSGLCFMLGFSYRYHLPRIKSWLLVEIENQSQKYSPLRIWPEEIDLQLVPPAIVLRGVRIIPKPNLTGNLSPAYVKEVKITLNWLSIFRGQFRLAEVHINEPSLKVRWPHLLSSGSTAPQPDPSFQSLNVKLQNLYDLPIDRLTITDLQLDLQTEDEGIQLLLNGASLTLANMFDALLLDLDFRSVQIKRANLTPLEFNLESRFLLDDENLQVSALKIRKKSSYLVASGYLKGDLPKGQVLSGSMSSRTHFALDEMHTLFQDYLGKPQVPQLTGVADLDLELKWMIDQFPEIHFRTQTSDLKVANYVVGMMTGEGVVSPKKVSLQHLNISNSAGAAQLKDLVIDLQGQRHFTTQVHVPQVELRRLLLNLNVPETPLHLDLSGDLPCEGDLSPLQITCRGQVKGQKLHVHSGGAHPTTIVEIDNLSATGEVKVDEKKVTYQADLKMGKSSQGKSSGTIHYDTGFDINYDGEKIDLSDVQNLAQLQLEGQAKIKGQTHGNSSFGEIAMNLEGDGLWLENFALGKVSSELQYKKGMLEFSQLKGLFQTTRYTGRVGINLHTNQLSIAGKLPYVELADIRQLLARKYLLPLEATGSGSAEIEISGPLVLNQLNFNLRSAFYRGTIATESFDELILNAKAQTGNVSLQQAYLSKAASQITAKGTLSSQGLLDLALTGHQLRLEQSESIEKLNLNITGLLDFTTSLRGPLLDPKTEMEGHLSQLVIADRAYEDSHFNFKVTPQGIEGGGNLMGQLIQTEFSIPLSEQSPFHLFVATHELNFAQLLTVFSGLTGTRDFESQLTSTLNLHSQQGGFFKSSGSLKVQKLEVSRGDTSVSLPHPIELSVQDGVVSAQKFNIEGNNTFMSVVVNETSKEHLDLSMNGKVDMSMAFLLTPFLDDLKGSLSLSGQLKGAWGNPELLGSAFVDKGLVKLKDFPHAFEQIRADLLFSHKNIVINAANGLLGGGSFTAGGQIQVNNLTDVPIDIKGRFRDVGLNIPEGVKTKGSGDFFLRGNWFPYTLGGELQVYYGDVTMEPGVNSQKSTRLKASSFLPDFLIEEKFQPVILDWKVVLARPILVKNSLVNSPITGSLKISGNILDPNLNGQLVLEKDGKVFFHETPFDVTVGHLEFSGEDTENPNIFLTANTRVKDQYDISLLIQGRAKDPQINLSSQPPLSETEIISLLALGIAPDSEGKSSTQTNELATQTTLQIGSALLQKPLGDINKLTGVEVDVSGATGSDRTIVPNLTLKKQWSPKLGLSASRTIENNPTNNAKIEYKVNKRLSVIGTWENQEGNPELKDTSKEKVGIDLEYRVEFK